MTDRVVVRLQQLAGGIALVAVALSQAPGLVVADTKLDLVIDPGGFLSRSLQAWDPQAAFGQLQNQAYGYLFPAGPFFWLGHAAGLPAWVVQRLWWVLILLAAYAGFLRLAGSLGIGTDATRLVAALAYALAPRVITVLGAISVEAVPLALLPWVLQPLVEGARRGSPRRAAAKSALAVACIGGINAAATLAVLVTPLLFLLTRKRGPRRSRLLAWWLGATALAVTWWFLPLLVLGRYAYPFLDYIETARTTTSVVSATNVLRGADHWVGFLVGPAGPTWPAGWQLASGPVTAAATVLVAGLGLAGLASRSTPERQFLAWSVLAGMLCVGAGYAGAGGGPIAGVVQHLLDGAFAAFRNVHKFDPVLRLPLALGVAAALPRVPAVARRLAKHLPAEERDWLHRRPALAGGISVGAVLVPLIVTVLPALGGQLAPPGSFTSVPAEWSAAAAWLAAHDRDGTRTLLVPGSQVAAYSWGRPVDEPLQSLASTAWGVRNVVPLGAPGVTRLLDGIEAELALGRGSDGLAASLARAGVGWLLLRNDLSPTVVGTPAYVARATLLGSKDIVRVAGFGPPVLRAAELVDTAVAQTPVSSLEVFQVVGEVRSASLLTGDPVGLSGGPEALVRDASEVDGTPLVAVADGGPTDRTLITDTLRRRSMAFEQPSPVNYTPTLTKTDDVNRGRRVGDVLPYSGLSHQTVARLSGVRSVTASTSAANPSARRPLGPAARPAAAFDGDPTTAWVSDVHDLMPSLTVQLEAPRQVTSVVVYSRGLPASVPGPSAVTVTTDVGSGSASFDRGVALVSLPAGRTSSVVLSLRPGGDGRSGAGVSEVSIAGITPIAETLQVPTDAVGGPGTEWIFNREPGARRACIDTGPGWACSDTLPRAAEEPVLDRTFANGQPMSVSTRVEVTPRQGTTLESLLDAAAGIQVSASSRAFGDAVVRPGAALDGDADTGWIPSASDPAPTLTVTLARPTVVSGLRLVAPQSTLARVREVVVRGDSGSRTVTITGADILHFPAISSTSFHISMALRPVTSGGVAEPLVVSEVSLLGAAVPRAEPVTIPCGSGPSLVVDGAELATSVSATAAQLLSGAPLPATVCGASTLHLDSGGHRLFVRPSAAFNVDTVMLRGPEAVWGAGSVAIEQVSWAPERRVLRLDGTGGTLTLTEGFNAGWVAAVDGHRLRAVRVDGWRQAWVIPSGTTGEVVLEYLPGRLHRAGLLIGLVALGALLLVALWRGSRTAWAQAAPAAAGPTLAEAGPFTVSVMLGGGAGLAGWLLARTVGRRGAALFIAGGSVLLAALVAARAAGWLTSSSVAGWIMQGLALALIVTASRSALGPSGTPLQLDGPVGVSGPREGATTAKRPLSRRER